MPNAGISPRSFGYAGVPGIYNDILKAGKEYKVPQHVDTEAIDDIAAFIKKSC